MSDHMRLYNLWRNVPQNAQKQIQAGRLKGKTDINPMWRIKVLTETFGPVGIGWWYTIDKQWLEHGAGGEISAFCTITLFYRDGDQISQGIPGTGGSSFVANERNGLYTSDECYKMALTDAISVACKALGVGADVYWAADATKYDERKTGGHTPQNNPLRLVCSVCKKPITVLMSGNGEMRTAQQVAEYSKKESGTEMCFSCFKAWKNGEGA